MWTRAHENTVFTKRSWHDARLSVCRKRPTTKQFQRLQIPPYFTLQNYASTGITDSSIPDHIPIFDTTRRVVHYDFSRMHNSQLNPDYCNSRGMCNFPAFKLTHTATPKTRHWHSPPTQLGSIQLFNTLTTMVSTLRIQHYKEAVFCARFGSKT
jgi:hypothetical protein